MEGTVPGAPGCHFGCEASGRGAGGAGARPAPLQAAHCVRAPCGALGVHLLGPLPAKAFSFPYLLPPSLALAPSPCPPQEHPSPFSVSCFAMP